MNTPRHLNSLIGDEAPSLFVADVEDLSEDMRKGLQIILIDKIEEVVNLVLR